MGLQKNEYGLLVRARGYGKTSYNALAQQLSLKEGETLYAVSQENGVRVSRPVSVGAEGIPHKPGTSFVAGPTITKAASGLLDISALRADSGRSEVAGRGGEPEIPSELMRAVRTLRSAGFGSVPDPQKTEWGWVIRMKGLILPGGSRTDALILLPGAYPLVCPIGFYLRKGANVGGLDTAHLFSGSYHGAPDLSKEGWLWFCGVAENWQSGRHDLLGFIAAVYAMLSERLAA